MDVRMKVPLCFTLPCFLSLQFTITQSRATGIADHILPLGDLLAVFSLPPLGLFVGLGPFGLSLGPLGPPLGISAPCALWLWLFRPLGSLWSFCVAIGSFFGLLGSVLCFLLCRLALLFWALCPSGLWPFGRLFFCACDWGARLRAFCGFALSFSLLPQSVPVPALACL